LTHNLTILDAHVHVHDCFDADQFLAHARNNFDRCANELGTRKSYLGLLLLTESYGVNWFSNLHNPDYVSSKLKNWRVLTTDEPMSMSVTSGEDAALTIIAGRQIVTAENLELLALGMTGMPQDGAPIRDVIEHIQTSGALCVLPWGFGKWTGARGRIVEELLSGPLDDNFFIGDNGGRPWFLPTQTEFRHAAGRGLAVLPGSDPFPFPNHVSRVGRFGAVLDCGVDLKHPFSDLRRILLESGLEPKPYGSLERFLPFFRNQIAMQLRKRLG
jgi:hypothetical protein